jgi:dipeptidase E
VKLFLSSNGLGGSAGVLRELVNQPHRAALVLNARDADADGAERARHLDRESEDLRSLGFRCEELDLRAFTGDVDELRACLDRFDLVWVVGGNTFVLARAMTRAGFADAIRSRLIAGAIVYAGYSAGACVTGPDLDGCHLMDQSDAFADGHGPDVAPNALDWVPWRIVPHWMSDHQESPLADHAVAHLQRSGLAFQALKDGEVIVVDGSDQRRYSST